MLTSLYVIDYLVKDLNEAKPVYDKIFLTEPLMFNPEMAPGVELEAMYYQMPGSVGHITTLGFFEEGKNVEVPEEGARLIGIQCRNIESTISGMQERGVKFLSDEPQPYAVGRNVATVPYNGVSYSISEHEPGGHEKARKMMFTRQGSNDFGDASQGGILDRVNLICIAVNNLDQATENLRMILGSEPVKHDEGASNADLIATYFAAPGGGKGVQYIALVALRESKPVSDEGLLIDSFLRNYGEGIYMVSFLVTDQKAFRETLVSRGIAASDSAFPLVEKLGPGFALAPIHNVTFWFSSQVQGTVDGFIAER